MLKTAEKHFQYVDALRGIAVLGVVFVHTAILTKQTGGTYILGFTGQRGVQLFYMLSAFTLCLSLDRKQSEAHPLRNYFTRRFFRIAPLYYLVILVNVILSRVSPAHSSIVDMHLKPVDVLLGFLFLNGVKPTAISVVAGGWSIAVETTFYLFLPFLFKRFRTVPQTMMLFAIAAPILHVVSKLLAVHAVDIAHEQYFIFFWFPVELPVFVLGMLTYCVWRRYIKDSVLPVESRREISLVLLLAAFMMYCACLPFHDVKLYFSSFLFLPLILALSMYSWPFFVNRFTAYVGEISYSMYLLHFFVLSLLGDVLHLVDASPAHIASHFIFGQPLGFIAMYLIALGLSIPLCMLSRRFIELPGMDMGRRLIAQREQRFVPQLVPAQE